MIVETLTRHLIKTISWRVVATLELIVLAYILSGSLTIAVLLGGVDLVIKSGLYLIHEIIWARVNFGRQLNTKSGYCVLLTGLSGSGKTTIANAIAEKLQKKLIQVYQVDGDIARLTFSKDLGFNIEDREENNKRAAYIASYLSTRGIVLLSFISPTEKIRAYIKQFCPNSIIVYVQCDIEECMRRDPKGHYGKLRDGLLNNIPFTGMHLDAQYEPPSHADLALPTESLSADECSDRVINLLKQKGAI